MYNISVRRNYICFCTREREIGLREREMRQCYMSSEKNEIMLICYMNNIIH